MKHLLFHSCQCTLVLTFPESTCLYDIAEKRLRVGLIQKQTWLLIFSPYFDVYPSSHLIKKTCAEIQLA